MVSNIIYFVALIFGIYLIYIVFTQPRAALVIFRILGAVIYGIIKIFQILFSAIYNFLSILLRWKK